MKTPQGRALCLSNVTLRGGSSFLATVHMGINRGIQTSDLDQLYPVGSICGGVATDSVEALLRYTLK